MSHWGNSVRHYELADGTHIAVSVDSGVNDRTEGYIDDTLAALGVPTLDSGIHKLVVEPTVIIACNADGLAEHLTPLRTFPPGTTHDDALAQLEQE